MKAGHHLERARHIVWACSLALAAALLAPKLIQPLLAGAVETRIGVDTAPLAAGRLQVGATASNAVDALFDDIKLDTGTMPAPNE